MCIGTAANLDTAIGSALMNEGCGDGWSLGYDQGRGRTWGKGRGRGWRRGPGVQGQGMESFAVRTEVLLMRLTPALTKVKGVLAISWFMIVICWLIALSGTSPIDASPRAAQSGQLTHEQGTRMLVRDACETAAERACLWQCRARRAVFANGGP